MVSSQQANQGKSPWFVYLIRTKNNTLYCGVTTDISRRFAQHCSGKGAKALKGKAPLLLEWSVQVGYSRSEAQKWEYKIKQLSKSRKEALILGEWQLNNLE
ncbi:GIY-YIG nuclease family protein [Vibrio astriarenae]|uniref:GIY-YIG nuclease family protein n=1 Tax=Vibrio astriarenae TaxID=1481923 RepID=A0A7Z2T7W3_9VIBR|nr:GIY-YIG nuclease family protein [Vibrio astriarenae]QIA65843.1 GIY-YIG nuclease family protein [Vibrio astriarenae]